MIFKPYYSFDTGCAAYQFGCGSAGACVVVDPQEQDVDAYVAFAVSKAMRITSVIDTHVHADHRSGGRELALRTGAVYCLHEAAEVTFSCERLRDGQRISLGNTLIDVIHTPGHSPESISLLVRDLRRGPEPWFVCTGDTLFVGAVGRPDLPGDASAQATQLYEGLHARLLVLPGDVEVYPGHFAGSSCGAGLSGKPSSTIAFERRWNPMLTLDKDAFVQRLASAVAPKPPGMADIIAFNRGQ